MTETLDIFEEVRKSKKSIIQNDLGSIRSTLFGKFYEGIIANWLEDKEGYEHLNGKPCVYWNETNYIESSESDDFATRLNNELNARKGKNIRTNSDGLFMKNNCYPLWEAKHWAKWDEGKPIKNQVVDILSNSPWILAKKVKHGGKTININEILFSWWQEFEGYEKIENKIKKVIGLPFKFYFTSKIIDDCRKNKYLWYQELINEQKENIEEFFKELLGEK